MAAHQGLVHRDRVVPVLLEQERQQVLRGKPEERATAEQYLAEPVEQLVTQDRLGMPEMADLAAAAGDPVAAALLTVAQAASLVAAVAAAAAETPGIPEE